MAIDGAAQGKSGRRFGRRSGAGVTPGSSRSVADGGPAGQFRNGPEQEGRNMIAQTDDRFVPILGVVATAPVGSLRAPRLAPSDLHDVLPRRPFGRLLRTSGPTPTAATALALRLLGFSLGRRRQVRQLHRRDVAFD